MTLVFSLVPHVLGPKYERRQRSRNSQKSSGIRNVNVRDVSGKVSGVVKTVFVSEIASFR